MQECTVAIPGYLRSLSSIPNENDLTLVINSKFCHILHLNGCKSPLNTLTASLAEPFHC